MYRDLNRGSKCLVFSEIKILKSFSLHRVVFLDDFYCDFLKTLIVNRHKPYIFLAKGFCYLVFFFFDMQIFYPHFRLPFKPKRIGFSPQSKKSSVKHISALSCKLLYYTSILDFTTCGIVVFILTKIGRGTISGNATKDNLICLVITELEHAFKVPLKTHSNV